MQFQIPQFIETENKIIGPLTLRQFLYIAAASGILFAAYFLLKPLAWVVLLVVVGSLGGSLAFLKINGQPFPKILYAAIFFYLKPQIYVWQPKTPQAPKSDAAVKESLGEGFSLDRLVSGLALKKTWRYVQTGSAAQGELPALAGQNKPKEQYQLFRANTGERRTAKRIDYR